MPKIRVLVVDDAVVFRRLLAEELGKDSELEVVGTAPNGRIALLKIAQANPDLVILDIEMPEMDGLSALAELRKTHASLPVIMFSALTERGAEATLDALALGATDYFTKPASADGPGASLEIIREQLIPKIKAIGAQRGKQEETRNRPSTLHASPLTAVDRPRVRRAGVPLDRVQIVAIGVSTGGPNALAAIFGQLPADFPVPIVIVQHMPPVFTRLLAERMSAQFPLPVREASTGSVLRPGHAWIAPGDHHMIVVQDGPHARILLHQDPPENSCRPAVDVLLRSVATSFGPHALAVILTGMGHDGLRGCEAIREAGGQILVQDEATSVVWGMPGAVARAGIADEVLPLSRLADEIHNRVQPNRGSR